MCFVLAWLFDANGDLALMDPKEHVLEKDRKKERKSKRGGFGQDSKEGYKENLRLTLKLVAPVPSPSFPSLPSRY